MERSIINRQTFQVCEESDSGYIVYMAREIARKTGFDAMEEVLIASAASELAVNMYRYADGGTIEFKVIRDELDSKVGIEITAKDDGPGIRNLKKALSDHYTTTCNSLGQGLPSVQRIMDEFYIHSTVGIGTVIQVLKWRHYA